MVFILCYYWCKIIHSAKFYTLDLKIDQYPKNIVAPPGYGGMNNNVFSIESVSGAKHQGGLPGFVGKHQPASSAGVHRQRSSSTACDLEETRGHPVGEQPQVSLWHVHLKSHRWFRRDDTPEAPHPICMCVQVHICRGWLITHPLYSGDRHGPIPVHGDQSGWHAAEAGGSASVWWVLLQKHTTIVGMQFFFLIFIALATNTRWYDWLFSSSASVHRWGPRQRDGRRQRPDHLVLWGHRHPQTHRRLDQERPGHQHGPESESVQVGPGFTSSFQRLVIVTGGLSLWGSFSRSEFTFST